MNFDGFFKHIGQVDVSPIKQLLKNLTPRHWIADSTRQTRYEVHKDTQTIALVYDPDFRHTSPTQRPALQMFGRAVEPVLAQVANYYDNTPAARKLVKQYGQGFCIRATLVRLNPGGKIDPHQDKNHSLAHSHRIHIPVITNPKVHFHVAGQCINMQEGNIIEINNRREHYVENLSKQERIHLILDWIITGEQCCCSALTHPGSPCSPEACLQTDRLKIDCNCYPFSEQNN